MTSSKKLKFHKLAKPMAAKSVGVTGAKDGLPMIALNS
jgi:hypothetical protein